MVLSGAITMQGKSLEMCTFISNIYGRTDGCDKFSYKMALKTPGL